jgi:CRISPR-associated protein Cmr5
MQTREQRFADQVYQQVAQVKLDKQKAKEYGSMSHKLPILIRTAGLAQALSFVEARKRPALNQLLQDLAATVGKNGKDVLLDRARNAQLEEYMLLTQHVMDALLWYKRFAQSVLNIDATTAAENRGDNEQ